MKAPGPVTMQTVIGADAIVYTVTQDGAEIWRKRVAIGHAKAARAGGYHTTAAAREQERVAFTLVAAAAQLEPERQP